MWQFVNERSWQPFHNLKNLSMSLSIETAELMEHTQWLTTEQVETTDYSQNQEVKEELADILSYLLAISNALDIDLTAEFAAKLEKNRQKYPVDSERTRRGLPTLPGVDDPQRNDR